MAIRDWFRRGEQHAKSTEATGVLSRMISTWMANKPLPATNDYASLVNGGYRRNQIIYACVNLKAASFAEPRLIAAERTPEGTSDLGFDHDLQRLLDEPNPDQDQYELLELLGIHYETAGEFFVHKVRSGSDKVVRLDVLRPDRIAPIADSSGVVKEYEYSVDGAGKRTIPARDVLHNCRPDPLNDYRGLSPIAVAARAVDMDNQSLDFLRTYFLNGGMPKGILKLKGTVSPEERDRVRQKWTQQYGGASGWHTAAVLDGDVDYSELGSKPSDMDLSAVFDVSETRICQVFQVPPILVAARIGLNRSTYANARDARLSFWDETMAPVFRRAAASFTRGIAREFEPPARQGRSQSRLICRWDTSDVPALQENIDTLWTRALAGWNAGLVTMNEARTMVRLRRIEGGDVRKDAVIGLDEPVEYEEELADTKPSRELLELASQLRLALPEVKKLAERERDAA
jgi:HK97 family phage portal protein